MLIMVTLFCAAGAFSTLKDSQEQGERFAFTLFEKSTRWARLAGYSQSADNFDAHKEKVRALLGEIYSQYTVSDIQEENRGLAAANGLLDEITFAPIFGTMQPTQGTQLFGSSI